MSQAALIGSSGLDLRNKVTSLPPPLPVWSAPPPVSMLNVSPRPPERGTWRVRRRDENITFLSWTVAIAASFLAVGLIGLLPSDTPFFITLTGRAGQGATDAESTELTMAELHAMEEAPEVVSEEVLPQVVEIAEPIEVAQDIPELAEALVTEDVFTIQAAPKIEQALKPIDPAKPKPKAQPAPSRPRSSRATTMAAATPNGTQGAGGGAGGTSNVGSGAGRGKFPKPNYPSSARSRGVAGRVTLALSISPGGQVENASAVSSQGGFTSSEQDAVAGFVERNWRFPTGAYRKHTVNIVFNLSSR